MAEACGLWTFDVTNVKVAESWMLYGDLERAWIGIVNEKKSGDE